MNARNVTLAILALSTTVFGQGGSTISGQVPSVKAEESAIGEGSAKVNQPKAGRGLITVGPSYTTQEQSTYWKSGNYEGHSNASGEEKTISLNAKYGLTNNIAVGVSADYGQGFMSYPSGNKNVNEGLGSPSTFAQIRLPGENLALIGSASLTPNLLERRCNSVSATRTTTCDRASGGSSATLALGAETLGSNVLGALVLANLNDLRTTKYSYNGVNSSDDSHNSGGNSYAANIYGERSLGEHRLGLGLTYSHMAANEWSDSDSRSSGSHVDFGYADVYSRLKVASNFELMPSFRYGRILNNEVQDTRINYYNTYSFQVGAIIGL